MQIKPLNLNGFTIKSNVLLAPMAGYTDYPVRSIMLKTGAGFTFTELASAKGIVYGAKGNAPILYTGGDYESTAVQIFGEDPYYMRSACENELLKDFKVVDINMGCPEKKVFCNGEGSALLGDVKKAEEIIKECVKSGKIITVKMRIGIKKGEDIAEDFAKMCEDSGASMITVHGRTREDYFSGEINYHAIEKAKRAVKIPVIANGNVFTPIDAERLIENTGADGIMIGRGAIENPFIFSTITGKTCNITLKDFILEQLDKMSEIYDDRRASLEFRKFVPKYFKGMTGVKELKEKIYKSENLNEIKSLIRENL